MEGTLKGRVAVVTGAGSGIGRATARELARHGAAVAVTDRDAGLATETANVIVAEGGVARAYALDVTDRAAIAAAAQTIPAELGPVSILVNNAGIGAGGLFVDSSEATWDRVLAVNLVGVVDCCRAFLPGLLAGGGPGHVVNIASMLGYTGLRGAGAYCASKFGVMGFSESLRGELHDTGVGVSVVCPGMIRTGIIAASVLESSTEDSEEARGRIEGWYRRRNYPPERVAKAVLKAICAKRFLVPVTVEARMAWYLKRWAPGLLAWLARRPLAG